MQKKHIYILEGDGIGPEVCAQVERIIHWLNESGSVDIRVEKGLIGGASYDVFNDPLTEETLHAAKGADAILLGAVGGEKWHACAREKRPEAGLLKMRKRLDLFANLRPAMTFNSLLDASTLKPDIIKDLDIMIVRELTSGVYFGTPRGMQISRDGIERCVDTQSYTQQEVTRVAEVAFELAEMRSHKVHSVEKSNVMETGIFWRNTVEELHKKYPKVDLHHMYADNCAMQLVRCPKQFDVILTDNLFGDMLSDVAAMCVGSLGMLPSASLGALDKNTGKRFALYEPVHGSAPDIAGRDRANPCAAILSFAMMMKYSFGYATLADKIQNAINAVLCEGVRTPDIMTAKCRQVGCHEMGGAILKELKNP